MENTELGWRGSALRQRTSPEMRFLANPGLLPADSGRRTRAGLLLQSRAERCQVFSQCVGGRSLKCPSRVESNRTSSLRHQRPQPVRNCRPRTAYRIAVFHPVLTHPASVRLANLDLDAGEAGPPPPGGSEWVTAEERFLDERRKPVRARELGAAAVPHSMFQASPARRSARNLRFPRS